jgi:hypothetical protein
MPSPSFAAIILFLISQHAPARGRATPDDAQLRTADLELRVQRLEEAGSREHQSLEQRLRGLESIKAELSLLEDKNRELARRVVADGQALEQIQIQAQGASHRSEIAAILMILGMVIEILGGTLLAGAHLSAQQTRLAGLRAGRPLLDLEVRDTRYEPILSFLGLLGSIAIVVGFGLQLAGTLVTSSLPITVRLIAATAAISLSFALLWFFLGQTPDQTRADKIKIIIHNVKRNILLPIVRVLLRTQVVECEICLAAVPPRELEVWWLEQENSEKFPYLHQPYDFHYGHANCLPCADDFVKHAERARNQAIETHTKLVKVKADDFIGKTVPELREWYKKFHAHWSEKRGIPSEKTAMEEQLETVSRRVGNYISARREI